MPIFKSFRKVLLLGDSLALTMPSMFVKINEIKKGNRMGVFYDLEGTLILANCGSGEELKQSLLKFIDTLEENIANSKS